MDAVILMLFNKDEKICIVSSTEEGAKKFMEDVKTELNKILNSKGEEYEKTKNRV